MNAAKNLQFLEQVVVWPGPDKPGYINLHTNGKNADPTKNGGKPFVVGWPYKTASELMNRAQWLNNNTRFYNAWYCTSVQSESTLNTAGKPKAVRLHKNATWLKALWVDIDVGNKIDPATGQPETKHYDTAQDAWAAVSAFRKKVGLPAPSAVVNSGGGLHVYWISLEPLTPVDWRPYAEGLKALLLAEGVKCDPGLTTDDVRILRVPGTFNHKYDPPKPVVLLALGQMYNFPADLLFLKNYQISPQNHPPAIHNTVLSATVQKADIAADFDLTPTAAEFNVLNAAEPLMTKTSTLVDPTPVFEQCAFLGDARATGGVGYDNTLWNLSVLCTAFMENGNALAHEISGQHSTYAPADTQALYDRKVADRADRGIGYPSCATIAGSGCKSCASCPLFSKGKSPLNIRPAFTATVTLPLVQSAAAVALNLPENHELDQNGIINFVETTLTRSGDTKTTWYPLFHCQVTDAYVTKNPNTLGLYVSTDLGNWVWAVFKMKDLVGQGVDKIMVDAGVIIRPENKAKLETFLMAFIAKMYAAAASQQAVGFGWSHNNGAIDGFAFGRHLYKDDGTILPAGMVDKQMQSRFAPTGQLSVWHDAWKYLQMQHRPDLEACVAASFAAPLIELSGTTGVILSCVGEKASGKTFALELGTAVWGHPKTTKENALSTEKSVINRMGSTKNLPAYWDEVSDETVQGKVLKLMDMTTAGSEPGRLYSDITQQHRGTWTTAVIINGNRRFKDFLMKKQRDHGAGLNRVFEYWVVRNPPNAQGQISNTSIPDQALAKLQHNYGNVGLDYARMLATNHVLILAKLNQHLADFSAKYQRDKEDRMWLAICAAIITGAELANSLPVPVGFDVPALYDFLGTTYQENVDQRKNAHVDPGQVDYGGDYLTQYLKDRTMETIWTKAQGARPPGHGGRPAPVEWKRLMPNQAMGHGINVRWDKQDNTLRFSARNFEDWCARDEGRVYSVIKDSLIKNYNMEKERRSLCAGCADISTAQEWCFKINVTPYPDLLAVLNAPEAPSLAASNDSLGTPVGVVTAAQVAAAAGNITLAENLANGFTGTNAA